MSNRTIENSSNQSLPLLLKLYFALFIFAKTLAFRIVLSDIPIVIMLLFAINHVISQKFIRITRTDAVFLSFIGISMIGINVTAFPGTYFQEIVIVIFLYISSRLISVKLSSIDIMKSAIGILSNSVVLLVLFLSIIVLARQLGINFFVNRILPEGSRLSWPFMFSNQLGIALTALFPLAILSCEKFWKRCIMYWAIVLVLGAVGSRASFATICIEISFLELIFSEKIFTIRFVGKGIMLFLLFSSLLILMSESYVFRRSTGQIKKTLMFYDSSRITTLKEAFSLPNSFILGNGLGCFKKSHKYEIHNTPISIFIETGIFGFIIASYLFYLILKPVVRIWRLGTFDNNRLIEVLMLTVCAIVLQSMVANLIRTRAVWLIFALCMSIPASINHICPKPGSVQSK